MEWYEYIGLIGSLISIGGAIYTYRYSTIIKKTKDEIFDAFKIVKFSGINENTSSTINQIKKVSHRQKIARGTNLEDIVNSLNDYYEKIHRLKNEKEVSDSTNLNELITEYREKINVISSTSRDDDEILIQHFNEIYEMTLNIDSEFNKFTKNIVEK